MQRTTGVRVLQVCVVLFSACTSRPGVPSKVTADSVRSIKLGMTTQEVRVILGEPVRIRTEPALSMTSAVRRRSGVRDAISDAVDQYTKMKL